MALANTLAAYRRVIPISLPEPAMHQMVASPSCPLASHHIDHPELLLLHTAVARLAERFISNHTLSAPEREALGEYRGDVNALLPTLAGPAYDFAEQLAELATTVLDSESDSDRRAGGSSHRAA
jgi:hypothetical protein